MALNTHPKLDLTDSKVQSARNAENELANYYDIDFKEIYIELNEPNIRLRVLDIGKGSPMLLVPGGVGDSWIFQPLIAKLSGYRIIALNRPGGGLSEGIDHSSVDIRRLANNTFTTVLNHFGFDRIPIIANSMGGLWSFWFALDHPERVKEIVQIGTPALILDTSAPLPMRLMSVPILNKLLVKTMIPKTQEKARQMPTFLGHPEEIGENLPESAAACGYYFPRLPTFKTSWLSLMERVLTITGSKPDVRLEENELRQIQQRVLFIWGSSDPFGSLNAAHRAREAVPKAELNRVGTGHLPWWDDSEQCAQLIYNFLTS